MGNFVAATEDAGADNENIDDSIVLPAERRVQQELHRVLSMRKAGWVWCNYDESIRQAWGERAGRLNDFLLSGFLLDTPGLFLTLGTEYSLKKSIYEDWKDVRKEIMNKIKLGPSMNVYLQ